MKNFQLYRSLLLQRLPFMLALLIVFSGFGIVTAMRLPSTYTTSARLLVEAPMIDEEDRRIDTTDSETLQIIEQQLITRANLIDVANKYRVFSPALGLDPDQIVNRMRDQTSISRSAGREQATLMTLGFTSESAQKAADVANEYVSLVLKANSRERIDRAEGALEFYEQEVRRLGEDLDAQSAKIVDFKNANIDSLPENLQFRQSRQALLQERLSRLDSELASLQAQRKDMMTLFETTGSLPVAARPATPEQEELARLQSELRQTLAIYAEDSPRVRALRNRIAIAEGAVSAVTTPTAPAAGGQQGTGNAVLDVTLAQIDSRVALLQKEATQTNAELDSIMESINATAANAITLEGLQRDQENIQTRYNSAVASLNQARTTERIETSARGQRITVIEGATVPNQPSGPKRKQIAAAGFGVGAGLAAGFFALMEFLNRTIRTPTELRQRFGITPISVIPFIEGRAERIRRRVLRMSMVVAVAIVVPLSLWLVHTQYMPLDILTQKILIRLGLG